MEDSGIMVRMVSLIKVYPPDTLALDRADISIAEGEIHSVIGENGAGKSTLMKVFYGMTPFDSGDIYFRGKRIKFSTPRDAVAAGIGMVHQEFMLIPSYTVYENVILGAEPVGRFGALANSEARAKVESLVDRYGLNLSIDDRAGALSVGAQQKVEILKLLYRDVDVLIMDEPTAVLTPQETGELFKRLRKLNEAGKTIIFISHKLDEVIELSHRITVMRKGKRITTVDNRGIQKADLARAMIGREVVFGVEKPPAVTGDEVLSVRDLSFVDRNGKRRLDRVSFAVRRGEIVGVAGVEGNGQFELVQLITGLIRAESGVVAIGGRDVTAEDVMARRKLMCHVPQNRKTSGSAQSMSLVDNSIMTHHRLNPSLGRRSGAGHGEAALTPFLSPPRCRAFTSGLIKEFGVIAPGADAPMSSLSGGNQQKMIVGREFAHNTGLILLDQPTRGLDVGSIEFIQSEIVRRRDAGAGCLLISADLDELQSLSDRILVMRDGRIVADLAQGDATREEIGEYMLGARMGTGEEAAE